MLVPPLSMSTTLPARPSSVATVGVGAGLALFPPACGSIHTACMSQTIGHVLREHREAVGVRAADVAERAHVPVDVLIAFEEGRGRISSSALDRVAYVLAVDPFVLREGRIQQRPTASLFFRHTAYIDLVEADRVVIANALERALALVEVNALLERPPGLRAKLGPEEPTPEAYKDGYRWARRVRAEIGNEREPLADVTGLLEDRLDVLVRWEPLASPRISALSLKDDEGAAAAILINASPGHERRRNALTAHVDLVHECAHVLLDPPTGRVSLIVDEDTPEDRQASFAEQRARAFAAEMLIPAEGLRELLGPPRYETSSTAALDMAERVRQHFSTPIEIAVNHLVNREYVVHWLRGQLIEDLRGRAGSAALDVPVRQRRDVLERRVLEALERDLLTGGRARELLGLSAWDPLPTPE